MQVTGIIGVPKTEDCGRFVDCNWDQTVLKRMLGRWEGWYSVSMFSFLMTRRAFDDQSYVSLNVKRRTDKMDVVI